MRRFEILVSAQQKALHPSHKDKGWAKFTDAVITGAVHTVQACVRVPWRIPARVA